jgi:transcriptional regulator with XRE-family HTH domain
MINRILELMKIKNLTSSQLADAIGVQRSGISHLVSGRNKPSLEFILKILNYFPDIHPDWLLFGSGAPLRSGHDILTGNIPEQSSVSGQMTMEIEKEPDFQSDLVQDLFGDARTGTGLTERDADELFTAPDEELFREDGMKSDQSIDKQSVESKKKQISNDRPAAKLKPQEENETGIPSKTHISDKKSPEKIVVFYPDRTFREYLPD